MIERQPVAEATRVPRHVAIIMDGNRRWARARSLPPIAGHRRGASALRRVVAAGLDCGVEILTVYAFSEENWQRGAAEVAPLLRLVGEFAQREAELLARRNVRVRVLGRTDRLPPATAIALTRLEERTRDQSGFLLNIAIDYSARRELADAVRAVAYDVARGVLAPEGIGDEHIAQHLVTAGLPDPDLLIRTGGELRLSNFLVYQCAYTELWSTPRLWPEFSGDDFRSALHDFAQRQRRFGR